MCSPGRMKGYYKNPEATGEFFKTDEQGRIWGCTGDIGYVDEDGEVFILGRATDSFRAKTGETIYMFDIEDVILKDEAIKQCKVVNVKIDNGKTLAAHLVLKEGFADQDEVIRRICENVKCTLPGYMVPEYYKIRESMPVHNNGKRDVAALKKDTEDLKKFE